MSLIRSKFVVTTLFVVATLGVAGEWLPARAIAGDDEREGVRRSAEGEGQRRHGGGDGGRALEGFRPQTEREEALFKMIRDLQREVADLRRAVQLARDAGHTRQGDGRREGEPATRSEAPGPRLSSAQLSKYQKMFRTYDRNGDNRVSFEERLAMRNYEVTGERLLNERLYHLSEDLNRDGAISLEEFAASRMQKQRAGWLQGRLLKVNADECVITVESRGGEGGSAGGTQTIPVEPKAIISTEGREIRLSDLKTGQPIFLFMSHDKKSAIGLTQR